MHKLQGQRPEGRTILHYIATTLVCFKCSTYYVLMYLRRWNRREKFGRSILVHITRMYFKLHPKMKTSKFHNLPLLLPTAILQLNFTWFCWNLAALQIFIHKLRSFKWFSHSDSLRKFPKVLLAHIPLPKDSLIPQMSFSLEFLSDAPNYLLSDWK